VQRRAATVGPVGKGPDKRSFTPSNLNRTWGKSKVFTDRPSSAAKKKAGLDTVYASMGVQTCQKFQNSVRGDEKWYSQEEMDNAIATGKYKRANFFEKSQPITTVVRNDGETWSVVPVMIKKRRQQVLQCVSGCTCGYDPFAKVALWKDTQYKFATHSVDCPWKDEDIPDGELPLSTFTGLVSDRNSYEVVTLHGDALPAGGAAGGAAAGGAAAGGAAAGGDAAAAAAAAHSDGEESDGPAAGAVPASSAAGAVPSPPPSPPAVADRFALGF